ncbi:sialate O-acetylesterase [Pedobacter sp. UYP30]|uniref:sialate O-acetylesterase n=1 Tax=Pedobacter sp. UYP30 TaxID=1756400 RepID=UPI0033997D9A
MIKFFLCFASFFLTFIAHPRKADEPTTLKINHLFSNNMVLQQNDHVAIWGTTKPDHEVVVSASWGKQVTTKAKANGNWMLKIQTPKAGGPYTISVKSNNEQISIKDVLIGEVWLASGQSNMDIPLSGWLPKDSIVGSKEEIAKANYPNIRFYKVPFGIAATPQDSVGGDWVALTPKNAGNVSATAFFYAKKLQKELGVPIGIIQSSIGGTPVEAWTSGESLKKQGDFNKEIDRLVRTQSASNSWLAEWPKLALPENGDQWKRITFDDVKASEPKLDDSKWTDIKLPGRFDRLESGEFDGAAWVRRTFTITDLSKDYKFHLDGVDDMDETFINGKVIGSMVGSGVANAPRDYDIPNNMLVLGKNSIAIRLIDNGGPGSVSGKMMMTNGNETIDLSGEWKFKLVSEIIDGHFLVYGLNADLGGRANLSKINSNSPSSLFNAMVNPLIPYSVKGIIWYQGESNVGRGKQYETLFPLMIADWREKWAAQLPFYFVQLAPYNYTDPLQHEKGNEIKNAQRIALSVPNTGMVVTLDIGRLESAHPTHKREVGDRLVRFALKNQYGRNLVASGPLYKSVKPVGNQMFISFEKGSIGSGLMAKDNKLTDFEIAGADKVFHPAKAKIKGNQVEVSSPEIKKPVYVRYAWKDTAFASLFNKEGLPASMFTSEN